LGVLHLLKSLGLGSDDQVIDGTIKVGALVSAVAERTRAGGTRKRTDGASREGNAIEVDGSNGSSSSTFIVANNDGNVVPCVGRNNSFSRNGLAAHGEVDLTKGVVGVSGEAEGDIVGVRAI